MEKALLADISEIEKIRTRDNPLSPDTQIFIYLRKSDDSIDTIVEIGNKKNDERTDVLTYPSNCPGDAKTLAEAFQSLLTNRGYEHVNYDPSLALH